MKVSDLKLQKKLVTLGLVLVSLYGLFGCKSSGSSAVSNGSAPILTNSTLVSSEVSSSGVVLSWDPAEDDNTPKEGLKYQLYYSTSNNITSLTEVQTSGLPLNDTTKEINYFEITNLSPGTKYYFNLLVTDEGNQPTAYTSMSVTTLANASGTVPSSGAESLTFVDSDPDANQLYGRLDIKRALDERNIDQYVIYWGSSSSTQLSGQPAIATYGKKGEDFSHQFAFDTAIPTSATHLLVYSKNGLGEESTPTAVSISDTSASGAAQGLTFTDTDTTSGEIAGTLTITRATSETGYTGYAVYWGSSKTAKAFITQITSMVVTGSDITYTIPANTAIYTGATHLLVFHDTGLEAATPVAIQIKDEQVAQASASGLEFGDTNPASGTISGTIILNKASSETTVNYYSLYLGSSSTSKISVTPFVTLTANDNDLTYDLAGTAVTTTVTHLLAYGVNHNGEAATPLAITLTDLDLNTNLIAYYPFDANGLDVSGNLLHGTLKGSPSATTSVLGVPNQALYLSRSSKEYVVLGTDVEFRPTDEISFGGWFYKGNWSGECENAETMISNFQKGGYRLYCESGNIIAELMLLDFYVTITTPKANFSGWAHIMATFDGRFFTLYHNGAQVAQGDSTVTVPMQYTYENTLLIGADPNSGTGIEGRYFSGKIDEVRLFHKTLSADEVLAIYDGEKP